MGADEYRPSNPSGTRPTTAVARCGALPNLGSVAPAFGARMAASGLVTMGEAWHLDATRLAATVLEPAPGCGRNLREAPLARSPIVDIQRLSYWWQRCLRSPTSIHRRDPTDRSGPPSSESARVPSMARTAGQSRVRHHSLVLRLEGRYSCSEPGAADATCAGGGLIRRLRSPRSAELSPQGDWLSNGQVGRSAASAPRIWLATNCSRELPRETCRHPADPEQRI